MNDKQNNGWIPPKEYDAIFSKVPRLCVDLMIVKENKLLLSWRAVPPEENTWHLIGGGVRKGETLEAAAKRIAKSELGLDITVGKFKGHMEFLRESTGRHSVSLVFEATPQSDAITLDDQSTKVEWFTNLPEKLTTIHGTFLQKNWLL